MQPLHTGVRAYFGKHEIKHHKHPVKAHMRGQAAMQIYLEAAQQIA
jgi:hypothetical protein